jgi:hypothetical protein
MAGRKLLLRTSRSCNMKKAILLFFILIFSACVPEVQNDKETLNKIFSSDSFKFEIFVQGCFAQSTNHFELEKEEPGYLLTCEETHKRKHLSNKNVAAFQSHFTTLLTSKKEKEKHMTAFFSIKANNFFNAVEYHNSEER